MSQRDCLRSRNLGNKYEQPVLGPFGLRHALLRVHRDLMSIHGVVSSSFMISDTPTNIEKMVVVLEDRRFYAHAGVDIASLSRECIRAALFRRHGGASTIDMQLVRTVTGYKKRKISRKIYEIVLSLLIQYRYSKKEIIRAYISCAFFGSHLYGADKASKKMWGLRAEDLDINKAAFLAAMLVYPKPKAGGSIWMARVERRAAYGMSVYIANKKRFDKLPS